MQSVPSFRLARTPSGESTSVASAYGAAYSATPAGAADACCTPTETQLRSPHRRARLSDLDSHLHCSVIDTCLSTNEENSDLDRQHATDLEIHHAAVKLGIEGGPGAKALQKALDARYSGAVRPL